MYLEIWVKRMKRHRAEDKETKNCCWNLYFIDFTWDGSNLTH
jgi:hypothetical protein